MSVPQPLSPVHINTSLTVVSHDSSMPNPNSSRRQSTVMPSSWNNKKANNHKNLDLARRWASETGVHGWKAFAYSSSKVEFLLWALIVGGAMGMIGRGIFYTVTEYQEQPTTTTVDIGMPAKFPPILLCHSFWVNQSRLAQMGLDETFDLDAIGRLFMTAQDQYTVEAATSVLATQQLQGHVRFREKTAGMELDELIRNLATSSADLVPFAVLQDSLHSGPVSVSGKLTTRGPCTLVEPEEGRLGDLLVDDTVLKLHAARAGNAPMPGVPGMRLYAGEGVWASQPLQGVPIGAGMSADVKLMATGIRRINRAGKPCKTGWQQNDCMDCFMQYLNRWCHARGQKPYYDPAQAAMGLNGTSTHLRDENATRLCNVEQAEEAVAICGRPCSTWNYQASVMPVSTTNGETRLGFDVIRISLHNPLNSLVFTEQYTETVDTFLSNLGGQISLWSGASLVTLLHIIMFCIFNRKENR